MNYQEPLKINNIDFTKLVYPKIKSSETKKFILIKYNDKSKFKNFVFQTPTLLNLSKPVINLNYADIEVSLIGKEKNKINNFINFLNNLEDKIKTDAQENANNWFNLTDDNKNINFQKIIRDKQCDDGQNHNILKLKIIKNNDFETFLQLNNNKRIDIKNVPNDSWCKIILECYGIWINNDNNFGIFFRPILISFTPKEKEIYNYKFIEDSEDNEIDIPETENNENIFIKINNDRVIDNTNDTTSQLDYNELIKNLQTNNFDTNTQDSNINITTNLLDLNLIDKNFDSESSESNLEPVIMNINDDKDSVENIDAETSDI